jgi:CRISPR-associated protein Csm1
MSLFFDGWLNVICEQFEENHQAPNSIYVIYAGGDDLFIVGPWNLMPLLAERIRNDLVEYVNGNPHITISAGISITDPHYPLYRSAELAGAALDDQAKGRKDKNAIAMLGQVVGWGDEWNEVIGLRQQIEFLLGKDIPKALVQILLSAHAYFVQGRGDALDKGKLQPDQLYYGRWHWMLAYSLTRLAARYEKKKPGIFGEIQHLQSQLLSAETIPRVGLAARWVDYLERNK